MAEDGSIKFGVFGIAILAVTIFALSFFTQSFGTLLSRPLVLGLSVVGATLSFLWARFSVKSYNTTQFIGRYAVGFWLPVMLWFASIIGPLAVIKADKAQGIPDVALYHSNGVIRDLKVYFENVPLSGTDSLYVVQYQEEPGRNVNNAYTKNAPDSLKSKAPRANESWSRPDLVDKTKLEGKY